MKKKVWRNGVMLAVPLAASVQCESPEAEPHGIELRVVIDAGSFAKELNECLADEEACIALCDRILVEGGYVDAPDAAWIYECSVTKMATSVEVDMIYEPYPVGVGCGVVAVHPGKAPSLGSHFAALAELEAASVHAFARLARDLRRHGAPPDLVSEAVRAASDEVRHTRQVSAVARAWGGTARRPHGERQPDRDLVGFCRDNAVDGCVHETFGAAIASRQAQYAQDPYIRSVMQSIARDEERHAALASDIDAWARPRLDPGQQRAIEEAAREAAAHLATSQRDAPESVSRLAGFPPANEARAIAEALEARRRARWAS